MEFKWDCWIRKPSGCRVFHSFGATDSKTQSPPVLRRVWGTEGSGGWMRDCGLLNTGEEVQPHMKESGRAAFCMWEWGFESWSICSTGRGEGTWVSECCETGFDVSEFHMRCYSDDMTCSYVECSAAQLLDLHFHHDAIFVPVLPAVRFFSSYRMTFDLCLYFEPN